MADRVLRAQCEHGHYEAHAVPNHQGIMAESCPGGREVIIDYEAARMVLQPADEPDRPYFAARAKAIVDAALEV